MSDPLGEKLFLAARDGRVSEVSSLLKEHPSINVSWTDYYHRTSLHIASNNGRFEVVKLLLAHPAINVNMKIGGHTPFSLGCLRVQVSIVEVLLKDPRVDITLGDRNDCSPLWYASRDGILEVIERLIASGRDLGDVRNKTGKNFDSKEYTALEIAREENRTEAAALLQRFITNPAQTRHEIRAKLGMLDELAAEVFALTVFLCDGLLQLKPASHPAAAATRFFVMTKRLSMELQMILCHSAVGSRKQNILRKDSEAAFKSLAILLLDSQSLEAS